MNNTENAVTGEGKVPRVPSVAQREQRWQDRALKAESEAIRQWNLADTARKQRDELLEALQAIGAALPKNPNRDRYGRTIRVASDWSLTEGLRHLAVKYDVGGSFDVQEQAGQVARAAIRTVIG